MLDFLLYSRLPYPTGVLFPLLIGFALLLAAYVPYKKFRKIKKSGIAAEGTIEDYKDQFPVVRFFTRDKKWITKEAPISISFMGFFAPKKGSKVKVYYERSNPENFVYQNLESDNLLSLLAIFGIFFFGWGLWDLYQHFIKNF